jgi:hypothetical protein
MKLCYLTRRPYPEGAESIGIWYSIIQIVSYIGAITNAAIIIFTADVFDIEDTATKWLLFLAFEHSLLLIKWIVAAYIPDTPNIVKEGKIWSNRLVNEKLYNKLTDVDKERKIRDLEFTGDDSAAVTFTPEFIAKDSE